MFTCQIYTSAPVRHVDVWRFDQLLDRKRYFQTLNKERHYLFFEIMLNDVTV